MEKMASIILSLVFILFGIAFIVAVLELAAPVILKGDFDRICDSYVDVAVDRGGLTASETNDLISTLENLADGITVIGTDISRAGTVAYKGHVAFKVNAAYTSSSMVSVLLRRNKTYPFVYEKAFAHSRFILD